METRTLLAALIGFFAGGLLVSVAATTFDKPVAESSSEIGMREMTASLKDKTGDEFDKAFIVHMIEHHGSALEMAELSDENAKHEEIKQMSDDIIRSQTAEIEQMKRWQDEWGYINAEAQVDHSGH